jgi:ribosomal protein S18 acetylase RimI-like enzyme
LGRSVYSLLPAADADIRALMRWFPDAASTRTWGGPSFRFPFTFDSFIADARWPGMSSWCLHDEREMLGFGQYYDLYHRIHLARIAVHPVRRGQGLGKLLLAMLMDEACKDMEFAEFSLYVYRDNAAAIRCYAALGFEVAEFPADAPLRDVTCYMIRSSG